MSLLDMEMGASALARRLCQARRAFRPPSRLNLIEWSDQHRMVSAKTSASPGRWQTRSQPVAYGPFRAVTDADTHTITLMAGTQVVKTEMDINTAAYFIAHDPSPILFVQPTQGAALNFSKERFEPTIEVTTVLREAIEPFALRNTITHKEYQGGSIDFVGANSPMDLASRAKRIVISDEIDKYPPSAGKEGDPLYLAEERASTYKALGRSKCIRTCSPTDEETSRIGQEYKASDQRRCFVGCPLCGHEQLLTWAHVTWSRSPDGDHLPDTATILCEKCRKPWTEGGRIRALNALEFAPDHGWRQTRPFTCCGIRQEPEVWNDKGRAHCRECGVEAPYDGHAGFHISKIYSKRHRLPDLVREFLDAQGDPEKLKKFTNTALAELWRPIGRETLDGAGLISRAELYGPSDVPNQVQVITAGVDTQGDRLEVQIIGWGADEESWPLQYEVIHQDPAQPAAWTELDSILTSIFTTRDGRLLRIAAATVDAGGHHGAQVFAFCRKRRKRRIFAIFGRAGARPIWPGNARKTKDGEHFWPIGVDTAKDTIYARLRIVAPDPDEDGNQPGKPGLIHFPAGDGFGPDYFDQLTAEVRVLRVRMGRTFAVWEKQKGRPRNEALDTFVGALAARKSLPRKIDGALEYKLAPAPAETEEPPAPPAAPARLAAKAKTPFIARKSGWLQRK